MDDSAKEAMDDRPERVGRELSRLIATPFNGKQGAAAAGCSRACFSGNSCRRPASKTMSSLSGTHYEAEEPSAGTSPGIAPGAMPGEASGAAPGPSGGLRCTSAELNGGDEAAASQDASLL